MEADKEQQQVEAMLAVVASTLEQALESICGAPRGFAIFVCQHDPETTGECLMLTNLTERSVRDVVSDALKHMHRAETSTGPAPH